MEMTTAGTVILMEFQKYPLMPLQFRPTHAVVQAFTHGSTVQCRGSATMLPA